MKTIKVLVVDDHPVVRVGITTIIDAQVDMTAVAEAGSGEEAIEMFHQHRPDVTVMDLRLGTMSGVECIRRIRKEYPHAQFVVLTTYQGDEDIHQALEAGANGYLIKGTSNQALLDAVRQVFQGNKFLPSSVTEALSLRTPKGELSHREREVLALLAVGKSNKEIAAALCIAEITVKNHLTMIFERLGVGDRTQAIVVAAQRGLVHLF